MIGTIENAIIAQLKAASDNGMLGYAYRLLDTYPDDFDQYFAAKKGQLRAPAAWCVFLALDDCNDADDDVGGGGHRFALPWSSRRRTCATKARRGKAGLMPTPSREATSSPPTRRASCPETGFTMTRTTRR